jgi:hypothetical protein
VKAGRAAAQASAAEPACRACHRLYRSPRVRCAAPGSGKRRPGLSAGPHADAEPLCGQNFLRDRCGPGADPAR